MDRGEPASRIDRHLIVRGLILIACEAWVTICFGVGVLQVLFAIGASLICMTLLRRLPTTALWALGLFLIVGLEALWGVLGLEHGDGEFTPVWKGLLFSSSYVAWTWLPGSFGLTFYPLLPWLGVMLLGWAFGRWLLVQEVEGRNARVSNRLAVAGVIGLAAFVLQRTVNGYGNYWLERTDDSFLRWLQVSKYPPSLAYCALELGLMALCLAAFFRCERPASTRGPLLVFGQTALFFYIVHLGLALLVNYVATRSYPPIAPDWGLVWSYVATLLGALLLYPICLYYRRYKSNHPGGWTRYL